MRSFQGVVFVCVASALLIAASGALLADPCLVVYPDAPCVYHYDPTEYFTVRLGDPRYDPLFDRGGRVLLERDTYEIDYSIYQAPNLVGFAASTDGKDGYFVATSEFNLIIDGFSNAPTTYPNIIVVFDNVSPDYCAPEIKIHGAPLSAMTYAAGDLIVSTPLPYGKSYSDVISLPFSWRGCYGMRIWAFSDDNGNGIHDGGECFSAYSHDTTVPVNETTWGGIKALYR